MWVLDHKESQAPKNWCFWTVVLEKTLESPLDCKEISPGCSLEGLMLKLKLQLLWPPHAKSWLIWKDPDAGKDWGQEKGTIEDETAGWSHRLNGHGFGWTPGVGNGQRGLACCDSWDCKESDTTERLNWTVFKLNTTWMKWFSGMFITRGRKERKTNSSNFWTQHPDCKSSPGIHSQGKNNYSCSLVSTEYWFQDTLPYQIWDTQLTYVDPMDMEGQ